MKIDFSIPLTDFSGEPIWLTPEKDKGTTLKDVVLGALLSTFNDEQTLAATEKIRRYRLALQVEKNNGYDFKSEDVAEIKRLIGKAYGPLVVGRAYDIIEPDGPVENEDGERKRRR